MCGCCFKKDQMTTGDGSSPWLKSGTQKHLLPEIQEERVIAQPVSASSRGMNPWEQLRLGTPIQIWSHSTSDAPTHREESQGLRNHHWLTREHFLKDKEVVWLSETNLCLNLALTVTSSLVKLWLYQMENGGGKNFPVEFLMWLNKIKYLSCSSVIINSNH